LKKKQAENYTLKKLVRRIQGVPEADASPVPQDLQSPPRLAVVLDPMERHHSIRSTVRTYCGFAVCIVNPAFHTIGHNFPQAGHADPGMLHQVRLIGRD
jgi:hypothetical protein